MEACGGACVGLMPRRGSGPASCDAPLCLLRARLFGVRRRSQTAVTSCTSGYFDSLLQLELHTSPRPAHMFMTNYIVPADHISVHQRVAESGVAM
jgi:hypothetical protein